MLWWARGGRLKGQSVPRIAFLKNILYSLPSHLSLWKEPAVMGPDDRNITATVFERPEEAYERFHALINKEERELSQAKDACYYGQCGEQAYIKYFGSVQPCVPLLCRRTRSMRLKSSMSGK